MAMHGKAQSAMEYLMTYGWAILIIAVVIAVLFALGVFNGSAFIGNECVAQSGFLCSKPIMTTAGFLQVSIGALQQISITGLACTANATAPSSFTAIPQITLTNGYITNVTFQCPIKGTAIGTAFAGTLWVQFNGEDQTGQVAQLASVATKATTGSITGSSTVDSQGNVVYVPITLTNSQGTATPAPFQQMLSVDSASYGAYINSGWSNVEFSTGAAGAGTLLNAWVESGNSNTATDTVVWVNLPGGIGAQGTNTIYMDFMPDNVMSASGPTGEAPQLSSTYAEYDNGASVFSLYDNFAGTSMPSGFTFSSDITTSVNNGLSISSNSFNQYGYYSGSSYSGNVIVEEAAMATTIANPGDSQNGVGVTNTVISIFDSLAMNNPSTSPAGGTVYEGYLYYSYSSRGLLSQTISMNTLEILGFTGSSSGMSIQYNYNTISTTSTPLSSPYYILITQMGPNSADVIHWLRARAYPPNGVMPGVSFG